ncbi:MAG: restriction endonuclease subunit S [Nitrospira sp.]|nr:restriction endonuclease subunit S [Nitrospira sp.]
MPYIKVGMLTEFRLPVPPLSEQHRIVGILDEAFDGLARATANAEQNLRNARALFESHLQSVFSQGGEGWGKKRLDQVCSFSSGGTPCKSKRSYWSGKIPWISGRDMKSTQLSDSLLHISRSAVDESSTRMAPAGTLLILVRGMGLAHGAQIAELLVPCAFNQDIRAIHPESDLIPRYLLFALRDRINSSDNVLSSAAHGTLKIDSDELKSVMIPVPSRGHQQRVVTTIDSLSEETQRLESIYQQKLAALDELKKSLLHQAFTGEL